MIYVRLAIAVLIVTLAGTPSARADDQKSPVKGADRPVENPAGTVSLQQLSATRERPLFAPDRRAPPAVPVASQVAPPPPPPEPPRLSLFGVVVDGNETRAIVRAESDKTILRARLGDEIGGWRVTKIERQGLVMSRDDRSVTVTMFASHSEPGQSARVRPLDRVFEVNAAGVLRSHRVTRARQ